MHYQAVLLPEKNGALGRNRTHNLLIRSQALYPVELLAHINGAQGRSRTGTDFKVRRILSPVRLPISPPGHSLMEVPTGLEPATSAVTGRHSNQLNYQTILVAGEGFEPTTFGL